MAAARHSLSVFLLAGRRCAALKRQSYVAFLSSVPAEVVPAMKGSYVRPLSSLPRTLYSSTNLSTALSRVNCGSTRVMYYSTAPESGGAPEKKESYTQRVKVVLKEYGPVAIVFHTVISLFSLGTCYLLVSRYARNE